MENDNTRLSLYVPVREAEEIQEAADKDRRSVSSWLAIAAREKLEREALLQKRFDAEASRTYDLNPA